MTGASLIQRMDFYARIVREGGFGGGTLAVAFTLLYRHFNAETGRCDPGQTTIARNTDLTPRQVKRAVDELQAGGWFHVKQGGGTPTRHGTTTAYFPIFERVTFLSPLTEISPLTEMSPVTFVVTRGVTEMSPRTFSMQTSKRLGSSDLIAANQFDEFWQAYPSRAPHPNPRKPAKAKLEAAVKRGVDPAAIIAGAARYAAHVERSATKPQFIKQCVTWLNQECWTETHAEPETRLRAGMC